MTTAAQTVTRNAPETDSRKTQVTVSRAILETKSRHQASDAMKLLLNLVPKMATVIRDGKSKSIAVEDVVLDDIVEVRPGSTIAVDGVVLSGSTYIDESMVTGESVPVVKTAGDQVVAGTINGNGSIQFRATAVGADTTLAKIVAFVESAQASKPRIQGIADRVVAYFVPVVLLIALCTALIWLFFMPSGSIDQALVHAVAVLIIACPCAMGLAVPTSVMVGMGKAAQQGILFRSTEAIELLSEVDTIAFDKTGTLTVGKPTLSMLKVLPPFESSTLLAQLALVERRSEHPLAIAVVEAAIRRHQMRKSMTRYRGTMVHLSSRTSGHRETFNMREITLAASNVMRHRLKSFSRRLFKRNRRCLANSCKLFNATW